MTLTEEGRLRGDSESLHPTEIFMNIQFSLNSGLKIRTMIRLLSLTYLLMSSSCAAEMSIGLNKFLGISRLVFENLQSTTKRVTFCLGNEAADADSIASALCHAYHRQHQHINFDRYFVPVVNVDRRKLHLRRDVDILLSTAAVKLSDLICIDDMFTKSTTLESMIQDGKIFFSLLDHNRLSLRIEKELVFLASINPPNFIEEIIDHHEDLNQYPHCHGLRRNIAFDSSNKTPLVGSCITLVAEEILQDHTPPMLRDVADIIAGVILLDTVNASAAVGKATSRDLSVLEKLPTSLDRNLFFDKLVNAKNEPEFWDSLSAEDALDLDFKDFPMTTKSGEVKRVAMASVFQSLVNLSAKLDFVPTVQAMQQNRDIIVIMALVIPSDKKEAPRRELMVLAENEDRLSSLTSFIQASANNLELSPLTDSYKTLDILEKDCNIKHYSFNQGNIKVSRKQLSAILQDYYKL